MKIYGAANLWKMDPYLKLSFQIAFKILVSILPDILMPQHPDLSGNSSVQSDSKTVQNLEEWEP